MFPMWERNPPRALGFRFTKLALTGLRPEK